MSCSMTRSIALLIVSLVGASATPAASQEIPSAAPAEAAPEVAPPDASPSEVYLMYEAQQRAQQAQLRQAARALEPLAAAGRREELERARSEILESLDTESLTPFLSRARAADWKAMPVAERRMEFARSLSPLAVPSSVEVLSEIIDEDRATLEVRGYFDEVHIGEPGWVAGTVTLAHEADGWKVDQEEWREPGSGEDDAPRGQFEISGGVTELVESPDVSESRWESHGGGWRFSLSHDSSRYVVMVNNVPATISAGEHALAARPSIPADADPATLVFPLSVVLGERSDTGGFDGTWNRDVNGTLTVDTVEDGRISGRLEVTARSFGANTVTVRASFRNVPIPAPEGGSGEAGSRPQR